MTNADFKITAKYWNEWACQAIKIVRDSGDIEDEPRIRPYNILLSYAFELMIKSRLVAVCNITETDLIKKYRHNIVKILKKLKSQGELEKIGIKALPKKVKESVYSIETTDNKTFYIYDFANIRYYPKPIKDSWDTKSIILNTAKIMLNIANEIHSLWKTP